MKKLLKMHVLIIDDDPHSIKLMERILHKAGYNKTSTALSAQEGIKIISTAPPDLILLDIIMPEMSGLRLCKKIKQDTATRDIPVIMVTGFGDILDRNITRSFRVGATDYITKPIHRAEFLARIEAALRFKQHSDRIAKELERRKKAEEALKTSEKKLQSVMDAALDAIVMIDPQGNIALWNTAAESLFGYKAREVMGRDLHRLLSPDESVYKDYEKGFADFQRTGTGAAINKVLEMTAVRRDGTHIPIELSVAVSLLEDQRYNVGIVREISVRKQAEKEREQLIARLREAMQNIKQLKELLPICAACKKIRDDQGYWNEVEIYIEQHTDAKFSHGICPECMKKLYPEL